jgi:glyceraldehyde 3-phosphate dehydrogenase
MPARIGINGFGRMGRLALRAGWGRPDLRFVHINEVAGGPETVAHLLMFVNRLIELAQKVGASL